MVSQLVVLYFGFHGAVTLAMDDCEGLVEAFVVLFVLIILVHAVFPARPVWLAEVCRFAPAVLQIWFGECMLLQVFDARFKEAVIL
jgi:hypothetical protein